MCCLVVQVMFDLFCLTEMCLNLLEVLTTLSISFLGGAKDCRDDAFLYPMPNYLNECCMSSHQCGQAQWFEHLTPDQLEH